MKDYKTFTKDCPERMLLLFRGTTAKVIDVCGAQLPELLFETDQEYASGWVESRNGLFVVDVEIENSKTWTEYGDEYDSVWSPAAFTPISDEMWAHYQEDEAIWPEEYYAEVESDALREVYDERMEARRKRELARGQAQT